MKFYRTIYGLNLAELLIAICIMSLAVITIIGMFMAGIMGMKKGDNLIVASNLAQSTIELYENEIRNNFDKYSQSSSPYDLPDTGFDRIKFTRKMTVKDFIISSTNKLKYVEISVYWYEKSVEGKTWNKPTEMRFSTYVNNYLDYPGKTP
ncbi:MAG: hypothetical protein ABRQ39_01695 [Candidatus Eremiobacterota bacterium]